MAFRMTAICDNCNIERKTTGASMKGALRDLPDWFYVNVEGAPNLLCRDCLFAVGALVPCPGEAHEVIRNGGDQDNCGVCAPLWGVVLADAPPVVTHQDLQRAHREVAEKRRRHTVVLVPGE